MEHATHVDPGPLPWDREQAISKAKEIWPRLTDADLTVDDGAHDDGEQDDLVRSISEATGESPEDVKVKLNQS